MRTLGCWAGIVLGLGLAVMFGGEIEAQQKSIEKQLDRVDWQPTWTVSGARYAGSDACAQCHPAEVAEARTSAMAHALAPAADSLVLGSHPRLTFISGPYRYSIERNGTGVSYTVTDGVNAISAPVRWAFGYGMEVAQTYLVLYNGTYYEGRASFFDGLQDLDVTLGHSPGLPSSLQEAIGRALEPAELRDCFGCHSTRAVSDGRLQVDRLVSGITCEGCHGPGAEHVTAMRAGKPRTVSIFNPGILSTGDLTKFCGACHRAGAQVRALGLKGIATVRFQPYRLTQSLCFNPRDRRISCLACHDPHRNSEHDPGFYDSRCLACHRRGTARVRKVVTGRTAPGCPVANSRCVTCHMPKYDLRGSHFQFTDHKIRVVRLGDTFD